MKRKANISIEIWASNVTIGFELGHDLDLEFSRSNMELAISQAKNGPIAMKQKANISIEFKASNATIRSDIGHDLDLEFSKSNMEFAISQPKMVRLPRNEKQTYRLNFRPQMWPLGLTWPWTWPWPWPWIFKVKYGIYYISTKSGPKVGCKDLPDSDRGDFRCQRAVDSSSYPCLNSLWPSDAIWHHCSWSILVQVMACYLTTSVLYTPLSGVLLLDDIIEKPPPPHICLQHFKN